MTAAAACGIAATALQLLSYTIYVRLILAGRCRPNGLSWLMWSYGTAVLLVIQVDLGTPVAVLLTPAFCLACSTFVTVRAFRDSELRRPPPQDFAALGLDVAILVAYVYVARLHGPEQAGRDAMLVFVLLPALSALVSVLPTLRSTFLAPRRERPLSWLLSGAADALVAAAVLAEGLEWQYLVCPLVTMLTQIAVAVLAMRGARRPAKCACNSVA